MLTNYTSTITVHEEEGDEDIYDKMTVIESFVVDVPAGNSNEETCVLLIPLLNAI